MAYVDLNPIRAGIAKTPEKSEFTSVYERIKAMRVDAALSQQACAAIPLRAFTDQLEESEKAIPYALRDYLALVDWSGRLIRKDKRGAIGATLPPILSRLGIKAPSVDIPPWTRINLTASRSKAPSVDTHRFDCEQISSI